MTVEEAERIMEAAFNVFDRMGILHLTGGGEPFLHPKLCELVETAWKYSDRFDRLMLFTNGLVGVSDELMSLLKRYNERIIVQISHYGINPERENAVLDALLDSGVNCKVEKYYGENQSFGGWVDFGEWEPRNRTSDELEGIFKNCAVTRDMKGNWRTRDGKLHWCTRSQRGLELGLIPVHPDDYIDLLNDGESVEDKRAKFERINKTSFISACDYCSGHQGTSDNSLRFPAAEQGG
jgi:hypothetical protein